MFIQLPIFFFFFFIIINNNTSVLYSGITLVAFSIRNILYIKKCSLLYSMHIRYVLFKTLQIRTIAPTSACVVKKRWVGSESTLPSLDSLQSLTPLLGQKNSKTCNVKL